MRKFMSFVSNLFESFDRRVGDKALAWIIITCLLIMAINGVAVVLIIENLGGFDHDYGNLSYIVENDEAIIVLYDDEIGVTEVSIPDEIEGYPVTEVRDFGVVNSTELRSITIGKNVRRIGTWAFTNNEFLEHYYVSPDNEYYTSINGVLYTKDGKTLVSYPNRYIPTELDPVTGEPVYPPIPLTEYTIPEGTEVIAAQAFYKCRTLEYVYFPTTLRVIDTDAFLYAEGLREINLPEGLTTLKKDAFSYCTALTKVVLPSTLTLVEDYIFYNSPYIATVEVKKSRNEVTSWGHKWWPTQNGDEIDGLVISYLD